MEQTKDRYLRVYYDAEFTELSQHAKLISIGIKSETGSYFYAEFNYDEDQISYNDWIKENVIDHLVFNNHIEKYNKIINPNNNLLYSIEIKMDPDTISNRLHEWLYNESKVFGCKIEFYTDCYAYDWMLLNSLICENGNALHIPDFISYIPIDLSTTLKLIGEDPDITREDYISAKAINEIADSEPFSNYEILPGIHLKHNALWDAMVCEACFKKIMNNFSYFDR